MNIKNLRKIAVHTVVFLLYAIQSFALVMVIPFNCSEAQERKLMVNEWISINVVIFSLMLILYYLTHFITRLIEDKEQ